MEIPGRKRATIAIDFITGLPTSIEGYDATLTIVDSLSKMGYFIPTKTNMSAIDFFKIFADRVVRYHGFPTKNVSDRDTRFI